MLLQQEQVLDSMPQITSYNPGTKVANQQKSHDGTAGWNTWHPTNAVETTLMLQQSIPQSPRVTLSGGGGTGAQVRAKVSRKNYTVP